MGRRVSDCLRRTEKKPFITLKTVSPVSYREGRGGEGREERGGEGGEQWGGRGREGKEGRGREGRGGEGKEGRGGRGGDGRVQLMMMSIRLLPYLIIINIHKSNGELWF